MEMKKYKLGELGKIITGKTPQTSVAENYDGHIPFITPSDDLSVKNIREVSKKITERGLKEVKNCLLPPRSICVSCIGSDMGKVVMTTVPSVTNQQFNSIVPNEHFDADYLYYLMIPIGQQMKYKLGKQSTAVPIVNKSQFSDIEVIIPSDVNEQKKVSSILSALDNRIENLRAQNRVLEQTAKTIYDYTFLQCAGHQTTYNKTLNRYIPANWVVCPIADFVKEKKGGDWGKENSEKNFNLLVSCVRGADIDKMVDLPIRYILSKNSSKLLQEYDLVVEISGGSPTQSTGRSKLITKELLEKFGDKLICSNFCQSLALKNTLYAYYFSFMWKMFYDNGIFFNFEGKTSGIKNFQLDQFLETKWFFPDEQTVKKFNENVSLLLKKEQRNEKQIKSLTTQRNTLLPLLMTGQIEV